MRSFLAGLTLALVLAGCGQADMAQEQVVSGDAYGGAVPVASQAPAEMEASTREEAAMAAPAAPPPPPADANAAPQQAGTPSLPAGPTPVLFLAYTYQIGLEIPAPRLTEVMDRHVGACQNAGPRLCQLIGSNRSGDPESYLSGYVSFRGEPVWLRGFMNGLAAEADAAGGRIKTQTTQSEDLTRQIVDTEARLRAMSTLRDRLQELLRARQGRLADLLEVERELARVQGEIDATQSNLAVMRTRVAMSELTLSYESAPRSVGSDTFEPLREAFANFLRIVVMGFAAIITIIAGLLPFAIVLGLLAWAALAWRRHNGGRFWRRTPKQAPPEQAANE